MNEDILDRLSKLLSEEILRATDVRVKADDYGTRPIARAVLHLLRELAPPTYKVRGPDPDGDYFIVEVIDGEENPLDETFRSEEEAIVGIEKLEGKA